MASLSIEEGAAALETGLPTVPVIPSLEREEEVGASNQAAAASEDGDREGDKEGKKKKNRCLSCKKKVGLTGFTCRCGGLFCSIHRYSDKHECNFDYKVTVQIFSLDIAVNGWFVCFLNVWLDHVMHQPSRDAGRAGQILLRTKYCCCRHSGLRRSVRAIPWWLPRRWPRFE